MGLRNLLYIFARKQRTKINIFHIAWQIILSGVPQGLVLGPFLFNILLCDLFLTINNTNSATHADDNTPYTPGENIDDVIGRLEETATVMLRWFTENQVKSNAEKFHLILYCSDQKEIKTVKSSNYEKLLGIKI